MSGKYLPGQVWIWWASDKSISGVCVLMSYVKHDPNYDCEVWEILDLDTDKAGRLCEGYLHDRTASGDGSHWERLA